MMIYKGDRPILYRKSKTKKQKEKIKQYEHRLKILNKKIDIEEKEIESFKEQYQKIFDVLNKLETKQQNLCEKWCLLADKLNNYEEKFIVRKPTMGVM